MKGGKEAIERNPGSRELRSDDTDASCEVSYKGDDAGGSGLLN